MVQVFEFRVAMTCGACSGALQRILERQIGKGVHKFEIDLASKTVTVETDLDQETITGILEKSGKEVTFVQVK